MSRTMPTQCEHGEIVDWGDFGPCRGDCDHEGDCPNFPDCPDCMETRMTPEQTTAINDNPDEAVSERDWVFARRFVIRRMIEQGDPSAADRIPDIPEVGAMQDEIEQLRELAGKHDPTGADHMEEMWEHAQRADHAEAELDEALAILKFLLRAAAPAADSHLALTEAFYAWRHGEESETAKAVKDDLAHLHSQTLLAADWLARNHPTLDREDEA